jgi:DNA-binding MarR family transcriptional regulator
MVARVPDITRLLDRLEVRGLVSRERDREDRRVVVVHATKSALRLLGQLDEPVLNTHKQQFRNLTRSELRELNRLLVKARAQGGRREEEDPR